MHLHHIDLSWYGTISPTSYSSDLLRYKEVYIIMLFLFQKPNYFLTMRTQHQPFCFKMNYLEVSLKFLHLDD